MTTKVRKSNDDFTTCKGSVFGIFRTKEAAERCYSALLNNGYLSSDVNLLMADNTRSAYYPNVNPAPADSSGAKAGSLATEGMGVGGAIGTAVGATLAAIAAVGTSLALPGLGIVIAGPIAAALAGGGAGAATGGLIGGLVGLGFTEQNAQKYNEALTSGGVVLSVRPRNSNEASKIEDLMVEYGGEEVATC